MAEAVLTPAVQAEILRILRHDDVAEVKREQGRTVVVEIKRQVKIKE